MTHICILTSAHPVKDTRIFHKEAISLKNAGYQVSLIANHPEDAEIDGVNIVSLGDADSHIDRLLSLHRFFSAAKSLNADVYHFHDPGLLPVGALLSFRSEAKVIYDCHEDFPEVFQFYEFPPDVLNPLIDRLGPRIETKLASYCDGVITATDWITRRFVDAGHPNVETIHNYPKLSGIEMSDVEVSSDYDYQLVYVGSLSRDRGVCHMAKIISELQQRKIDVGLWLIGTFTNSNIESDFHDLTEEIGVSEYIRHFGRVDYDQIFSYLSAADVGLALLNPEQYDRAISTKIFEYMYAGIPVVASNTVANQRYVTEETGAVVPWDNHSVQADTIERLILSTNRRRQQGLRGKELVENEYSWINEEKRLLHFYDRLLTSRKTPRR